MDNATIGETPSSPKLLDQVRNAIRIRHYSLRTEESYVYWIRWFVRFSGLRHPRDMGARDVTASLTHLAVERDVAAATQQQALSALLFLYKQVLEIELPRLNDIVRSKKPALDSRARSTWAREGQGMVGAC